MKQKRMDSVMKPLMVLLSILLVLGLFIGLLGIIALLALLCALVIGITIGRLKRGGGDSTFTWAAVASTGLDTTVVMPKEKWEGYA